MKAKLRECWDILGGIADAALALVVGLALWPLDALFATWQKHGRRMGR